MRDKPHNGDNTGPITVIEAALDVGASSAPGEVQPDPMKRTADRVTSLKVLIGAAIGLLFAGGVAALWLNSQHSAHASSSDVTSLAVRVTALENAALNNADQHRTFIEAQRGFAHVLERLDQRTYDLATRLGISSAPPAPVPLPPASRPAEVNP